MPEFGRFVGHCARGSVSFVPAPQLSHSPGDVNIKAIHDKLFLQPVESVVHPNSPFPASFCGDFLYQVSIKQLRKFIKCMVVTLSNLDDVQKYLGLHSRSSMSGHT